MAEASDLSLTAVRSLEMGYAPRQSTMLAVRHALENAGVEFIDCDGVRRRSDGVNIYQGQDSCDKFFKDVLETTLNDGSDVFVYVKTSSILTQPCGLSRQTNLERLLLVHETCPVYCLLSDAVPPALLASPLEVRTVSPNTFGATSCVVYGNKLAQIFPAGRLNVLIVVFTIGTVAQDYRKELLSVWGLSPIQRRQKQGSVKAAV